MLVDLHLHSQYSDGTKTPREIVQEGARLGYGILALADHNTDAGWEPFSAACRDAGILPLRGMELDCLYDGLDLHILAYGYAPSAALERLAGRSLQILLDMSDDLVRKLLPHFPQLSWEEWQAYAYDRSQGGWKGIHYLRRKGLTQRLEEGLGFYARYGCDYQDYPFPSVAEACKAIRDAGGRAVLAHPCNWFASLSPQELLRQLDAMRELGIQGIECFYPANPPEMTRLCQGYCREHGMLITQGSDWHGAFCAQRHGIYYRMGEVRAPLEELALGDLLLSSPPSKNL